jgi:hypothetical protein
MKKKLFLIFLACIGLSNCIATSSISMSNSETLISSTYKKIEHGYFVFLVFVSNTEIKELTYHYSIDLKNKKVTCFKESEKVYNLQDRMDYLKNRQLQTGEEFKRLQINTWREKYYSCFSSDFLSKTNDEKLILLNKLSEK